ncbi:hypothetical protein EXS66_02330 [Candidatus Saccharibacteria bacterium]|nr:hypothetical protein [Candidatus Saccharibacteria bacterium]
MVQINKTQTKTQSKDILYCFSPLVMLITFMVEMSLAIYVFIRVKPSRIKNIVIIILNLLAIFQLAEFFVCGTHSGLVADVASRVGYIAITFLPATSIILINEIAGRKRHWTTAMAMALATGFAVYFGLVPGHLNNSICTGNYVIFSLGYWASTIYAIYYFGVIFMGIGMSYQLAKKQKSKLKRNSLHWLIVGALSFLVPTGLIYWITAPAVLSIPSVMCGFAIIYAIILVSKIIPQTTKAK